MEFHPITLADRERFSSYTLLRKVQNCDLSFANIFCWQDTYRSEVAEDGGFLFIRFRYGGGSVAYMQPVGDGDPAHAIGLLREDARQLGVPLHIVGMTDWWWAAVERLYPEAFAFAAPRSHFDYIYRTADLASLAGSAYKPKRNHINRFTTLHKWHVEPIAEKNIGDCRLLNSRWLALHDCAAESERAEQSAMARAFDNFEALGLRGLVLYADGEAAAFTYGSAIDPQTFCTHVEKADVRFDGAAAMINRLFAESLAGEYGFINREDDLGLEGLRFSKLSYRPCLLLKKISGRELSLRERQMRTLWEEVFGDGRTEIDTFLMHRTDPDMSLAREVGGKVAAMLHIVPMRSDEGLRLAYIYAVATAEEHRNRGLASSLLEEALGKIKDSGKFDAAMLIPSSEASRRLYARHGFSETLRPVRFRSEYDFGTGNTDDDLAMVLHINKEKHLRDNEYSVTTVMVVE